MITTMKKLLVITCAILVLTGCYHKTDSPRGSWLIRYSAHMEGIVSVDLTLLITMMMGLCGAISGAVMNCKPVTVCSALATALSVVFVLLVPNGAPVQILTFLILGVFALIIPGVILQNKAKA